MGASSPNTAEALRTLGKYALIEKLGEGRLGPVFRGFDQDLDKPVVVRILSDAIRWNASIQRFFFQVCKTIVDLEHPNIVSVFDVGQEDQSVYIVMESLGSGNLKTLLKQKPELSAEAKLYIMIQVVEGLNHAHKKTILHRDLEPGKIHLMPDGSVKIRDFALAHVLSRHLPRRIVHWKKPLYLSPEQIQKKDSDERSDIFSVGTIFFELLTYFHPFYDSDNAKTPDGDLSGDSLPTFEQFPDVPPGFWPILKTCMAADPEDRYKSMDELLAACKDLRKSLAEDTQLMLSELYASQSALKKAAAQPEASESTVGLLRDIQKLSRGDKKPDCITLDRMTTTLIGQYPIIQAAADAPDAVDPQPDFEIAEAGIEDHEKSATASIPSEEPVDESHETDSGDIRKSQPEPPHSSMAPGAIPEKDTPPVPAKKDEAEIQPDPVEQDSSRVHSFDLDHKHGLFGGSCRGVLMLGHDSIEYNPFFGHHGFRIPFKLLRISKIDRRSVRLSFASDDKHFQSFQFQDDDSAERFNRIWNSLKAVH